MAPQSRTLAFINLAHLLDHLLMLVFPTAVLGMGPAFGLDFAELLPLATGGFIAFGAGSLPAGWLADRWNRRDMLAVFFLGSGLAASRAAAATPSLTRREASSGPSSPAAATCAAAAMYIPHVIQQSKQQRRYLA